MCDYMIYSKIIIYFPFGHCCSLEIFKEYLNFDFNSEDHFSSIVLLELMRFLIDFPI